MAVSGTLSPADIDLYVRIYEMDRQIKLGGTAEQAFVPVSNNSDESFF